MTKDEALKEAINIAESWIRDQLEGTGMFNDAMKELEPLKAVLAQQVVDKSDPQQTKMLILYNKYQHRYEIGLAGTYWNREQFDLIGNFEVIK